MGKTIKLSTKRQATFPVEVCEQLGVQPGDEIELHPRTEKGARVWVLRKRHAEPRSWIGSLRAYAKNAPDHSMEAIRESIKKGRRSEP